MKVLRLITREIVHRKWNFLLSLIAVITAVAFSVALFTTGEASKRETKRTLRDLGQNLRIIAKDSDMDQFWDDGFSDALMPEDWVHRFENVKGLFYSHLTATLEQKIAWDDRPAILTGITAEVSPPDRKKPSMVFKIKPGTVYVGHQLAVSHGLKKGDSVDLLGKNLTVANTLAEAGTKDDLRITGHLSDVQEMLDLPGQINEIRALDCYCRDATRDTLTVLREQLKSVLPGAKVVKMQAIALAREKQRTLIEDYFSLVVPLVIIVCGIWIGALAFLNTRERRSEIGILRALGYGSFRISVLFLGKAVLVGLLGAAAGFALGNWIAMSVGPDLFKLTAKHLKPDYSLLGWSLLAAPAFAAVSAFIPAMLAVSQDPASSLRDD
ncbi:MAG: putative ABC transport system permease protein [Verrucomicrobiales bacterium]|jgi:putative ABC transport system permease protein